MLDLKLQFSHLLTAASMCMQSLAKDTEHSVHDSCMDALLKGRIVTVLKPNQLFAHCIGKDVEYSYL